MEPKEESDERQKDLQAILDNQQIKGKEQMKYYDVYAKYYDVDANVFFINRDKHVEDFLDFVRIGKKDRILDAPCGTGAFGQMITKRGYTNIDALDSSEGMLQQAKAKGVYKNCFQAWLGPQSLEAVGKDTYDAILCAGALSSNHIDDQCFESLASVTKPDGHVYFLTVLEWLSDKKKKFEDKMRKMEEEGIWKWVLMKESPDRYFKNVETNEWGQTLIYAFKVLK